MEWWQRLINWFVVRLCDHELIADRQITWVQCVKCEKTWYYKKNMKIFYK
jgi:hypothetical protein